MERKSAIFVDSEEGVRDVFLLTPEEITHAVAGLSNPLEGDVCVFNAVLKIDGCCSTVHRPGERSTVNVEVNGCGVNDVHGHVACAVLAGRHRRLEIINRRWRSFLPLRGAPSVPVGMVPVVAVVIVVIVVPVAPPPGGLASGVFVVDFEFRMNRGDKFIEEMLGGKEILLGVHVGNADGEYKRKQDHQGAEQSHCCDLRMIRYKIFFLKGCL